MALLTLLRGYRDLFFSLCRWGKQAVIHGLSPLGIQTERSLDAWQKPTEQQKSQLKDTKESLRQESAKAYIDFFDPMFYY